MGGLNKSFSLSQNNMKVDKILVSIHGLIGTIGNTLPCPDMAKKMAPEILGAHNSTNKVGTLIGGSPD